MSDLKDEITTNDEEPVKKPARRRSPVKKATAPIQTESAIENSDEVEKKDESISQAAEEIIPIESISETVEISEQPDDSVKEVEQIHETVEAFDNKDPQHPGIVHLKTLIAEATDYLNNTKMISKKMSKQLKKLDAHMIKLPKTLRKINIKEAAKAEKFLFRLREKIAEIPTGNLKKKGLNTLSQDICKLRKKLPGCRK